MEKSTRPLISLCRKDQTLDDLLCLLQAWAEERSPEPCLLCESQTDNCLWTDVVLDSRPFLVTLGLTDPFGRTVSTVNRIRSILTPTPPLLVVPVSEFRSVPV